jgi:hypothetical protein
MYHKHYQKKIGLRCAIFWSLDNVIISVTEQASVKLTLHPQTDMTNDTAKVSASYKWTDQIAFSQSMR